MYAQDWGNAYDLGIKMFPGINPFVELMTGDFHNITELESEE